MKKINLLIILLLSLYIISCNGDKNTNNVENDGYPPGHYDIEYLGKHGQKLTTSSATKNARGIDLYDNDTKLIVHSRDNELIVTYKLISPNNLLDANHISSISTSDYIGTESQGSYGHGIFIKRPELDRIWLFNRTEIWQFDLSTPGEIDLKSNTGYYDLSQYIERGHDIDFSTDGKILYIDDRNKEAIHQFKLQTPWDINNIEFDYSLDISANHKAVRGIEFRPDGKRMYLLDTELRQVQQYTLSTAWDIRSSSLEKTIELNISNARGMTWNQDGGSLFIMNTTGGIIERFEIDKND